MPEEVLFETERRQTRAEIADYLRTVADRLEAGEDLGLSAGDQSVTLAVPDRPTFEVKAEREGYEPDTELSVEFELEWDEHGGDDGGGGGDLTIE
jgi:amphi-Trp domain-containing protein